MPRSQDHAGLPPAWLTPLLGTDAIVASPAPVATALHAARGLTPDAEATPRPSVPGSATYFAVVDPHDPNRVLSFHALTAPAQGGRTPRWCSFVGDDWLEDPEQAHTQRGPLRWVPESTAQSVVDQFLIVHSRRGQVADAPSPESLRARFERALVDQSTGHVELGRAYLQWAGYPDGLLIEVGDPSSDGAPLEADWAEHLGWLGWQAPDAEHVNAWYQAEHPHAVEQALDLVGRTNEVLRQAMANPPDEEIEELRAEDLSHTRPDNGSQTIERAARDLPELLEVLGCPDVAALEEALWDEFDDPDAALDLSGEEVFVVAHASFGVGVPFPLTASEFWALVREHYTQAEAMDS